VRVLRETRSGPRSWVRALALVVGLLVIGVSGCATSAPPPPVQLAGRALGSSFVAVTGTGFPVNTAAQVTGTTPQGTTTVAVTTDQYGGLGTSVEVPKDYRGPLEVKATVGSSSATTTVDAGGQGSEPGSDAGARKPADVTCSSTSDVTDIPSASPGDVVCLKGESDGRVTISHGGTPNAPVTYNGGGETEVQGIDVVADDVIVEGFVSKDASNMGARLQGNRITFRDNTIDHPVNGGDDTDGMRFFGNDITIDHNTIEDVSDGSHCDDNGCGDGPHPDCMQTYYSDQYPTSSNVTIESNRCTGIAAQCLIGEGPQLPAEGVNGPGQSANWIYYDNYCESSAAQAVQLKDIENATIASNQFAGRNNKAIALSDGSTGTHVGGNVLGPKIPKLITFDDPTVAAGYVGPTPDEQQ
jgi:hypothetical protein